LNEGQTWGWARGSRWFRLRRKHENDVWIHGFPEPATGTPGRGFLTRLDTAVAAGENDTLEQRYTRLRGVRSKCR
jgi:hypothetical protein